ncbi:MAG TPA: DUF4097 family beta strand repeat-containing protein, partial [Candidatus Aquilonibacter sp.]
MMTVRPHLAIYAAVTLLALLPTAGCIGGNFGAHVTQDVHTRVSQAPQTLELHDPVGAVTLDAWKNAYVQIDARKRAPSRDDLQAMTISVKPDGGKLVVTGDLGGSNTTGHSIDFTIHAPASTNLDVQTNVGGLSATGFSGNVDADVNVGGVKVTMAALRGSQHVNVTTSVGGINLDLPAGVDATFDADTTIGGISSSVPLSIVRKTVGATAGGRAGSGSAHVTLKVSTGGIRI